MDAAETRFTDFFQFFDALARDSGASTIGSNSLDSGELFPEISQGGAKVLRSHDQVIGVLDEDIRSPVGVPHRDVPIAGVVGRPGEYLIQNRIRELAAAPQ